MLGVGINLKHPGPIEEELFKSDAGNVVEEMKKFGKECREDRFFLHLYIL